MMVEKREWYAWTRGRPYLLFEENNKINPPTGAPPSHCSLNGRLRNQTPEATFGGLRTPCTVAGELVYSRLE